MSVSKELQDELGQALHIVRLDVRNRAAIQQAIEALPAELRQIDVLVNNAGLALGLEPAHKANADDWETMIDTNAKGLVNDAPRDKYDVNREINSTAIRFSY